ncbi:MAG: VWA domain-containing protein [Pyrinomonadaceae bacterium]|nr:VWA domain-containing protein [Pyrinomonadaceae bacterium]
MNKRLLTSLLLLFSFALSLSGQTKPRPTPPPEPNPKPGSEQQTTPRAQQVDRPDSDQDVVRITTNLVQIDVVVSKDGKQVKDLNPEDFEILEDGRAQTITSFSYVSNLSPQDRSRRQEQGPTAAGGTSGSRETGANSGTDAGAGRTFALVVDDLGMSFESITRLRRQLRKFIDEQRQPNDLVALLRTGGEVGALQQFTSDPRVLHAALDQLKWNPCSRVGTSVVAPERSLITSYPPEQELIGPLPPDRSPSSAGVLERTLTGKDINPCPTVNSLEYSIKSLRFILRGMRELPGRKSLLLFSDNLPVERQELAPVDFGFKRPVRENANIIDVWTDSTSYADALQRLAELAIRASVVIYGIDSQSLQTVGPHPADEMVFLPMKAKTKPDQDAAMKSLRDRTSTLRRNAEGSELVAKQTGGFVIRNSSDFGLQRVLDDQIGYYLIGYRPGAETFNRSFHHIQARVKRRGLAVRTRAGFYGITEDERNSERTNRSRLEHALISPFGANEVTVRLHTLFVDDPVRGSILRVTLLMDSKDLSISNEADGAHKASVDIVAAFFGDNGRIVARQDQNGTLRLRGKPYERALRDGMVYNFDMPVKQPGGLQFRVAIRDPGSSRIGTAGQFVEIPNLTNGKLALSSILLQAEDNSTNPEDTAPESAKAEAHPDGGGQMLMRFHKATTLMFVYAIYNARLDRTTKLPQLSTKTRVLRNREQIYTAGPMTVSVDGQSDLRRISAGARLQLGSALSPGEYVLQIVVEDQLGKQTATQWVQFEVVSGQR